MTAVEAACDDQRVTSPPLVPLADRRPADPRRPRGADADDRLAGRPRDRYDFIALRWLCPCAYCRGEAGMPGWLDTAPTLTAEQTRMVDIQLVGNYAVAPHWADGHHTGYYTFALLRERCPCADCTAARGSRDASGPTTTHDTRR